MWSAWFGAMSLWAVWVMPLRGVAVERVARTIDFARTNGVIRPLHGVNLGPLCYRGTVDLSAYHRELAIPLTRLHDVVWVNAEAVDIHTIFRDFRADADREESYFFGPTDEYIRAIVENGSRIVYRLGESIEHTSSQHWVHPPPDPQHWAQICLGIIRHYNEGWAGGFQHGIEYWEIWNEPDVRPAMWTGSDQQYFALYEAAAKAIRARFPKAKVGGPALGGSGQFRAGRFEPSAFLTNFLAHCRAHDVPLDFFSWHCYTSSPDELVRRARAIRRALDAHGFASTESHLNEWNYLPNDDWAPMLRPGQGAPRQAWYAQMNGPAGAAFIATALSLLQEAPIDAANFYTGEIQGFGLFDFNGAPKKTFYAFKAFREMLDTPVRLAAEAEPSPVTVLAGVAVLKPLAQVLISNAATNAIGLDLEFRNWPGANDPVHELRIVDGERDGDIASQGPGFLKHVKVPASAVLLLRIGSNR